MENKKDNNIEPKKVGLEDLITFLSQVNFRIDLFKIQLVNLINFAKFLKFENFTIDQIKLEKLGLSLFAFEKYISSITIDYEALKALNEMEEQTKKVDDSNNDSNSDPKEVTND